MILLDVNVLVYCCHKESPRHPEYQAWLHEAISSESAIGLSDLVLSSVVRICTNPRVFVRPAPRDTILGFCNDLRSHPKVVSVAPGKRHWDIFTRLCREGDAKGNLVTDAYLAALAIESGAEWITTDRDFARFPGLKWRHPLA
ncbi:MAG: hypothetical protein RLZZ303_798 [Candidatus Hydrogenedentota bacterium]